MRTSAREKMTATTPRGSRPETRSARACIAWIVAIAGSLWFPGCEEASQQKAASLRNVSLAENPVPLSSLTIVARNKGFFQAHGLDVQVKEFTSGKLALDAVLGGGAHFATVAETPLMYAGFAKQPAVVLATFTYSDNDCKVAARKDMGIEKPTDLRGKRVGTFVGTSAEFFMSAFLEGHGLSSGDVQVVSLRPPEMVAALDRGDIAAFFVWEPFIHKARRFAGDRLIVFTGTEFYTETFNLATTKDYAQKNADVTRDMLKALLDAEQFVRNYPEEATAIVSRSIGIDETVLREIWADFNFEVVLDPFLLRYMKEQARWAIDAGRVSDITVPNYEAMIYAVPLNKVKPSAVKIGKD